MTIEHNRKTAEQYAMDKARKEALFHASYAVTAHTGSRETAATFLDSMAAIHRQVFYDLYCESSFGDNTLAERTFNLALVDMGMTIADPLTQLVTLTDQARERLVGFTFAHPAPLLPEDSTRRYEFESSNLAMWEYLERQERTAEVGWTEILPEHRSQGGWSHMMDVLEEQLRNSGRYDEMLRFVRIADNYAEGKVRGRYAKRIVYEADVNGGRLGMQKYFRIRIR